MSNSIKTLPAITVGTTAVQADTRGVPYHKYGSLFVQADPSNTGNLLVGDNNLSTTRYAASLAAGQSFSFYGSAIDLRTLWLLGSAAGQVAHVSGI